jgi:predicted dienelactone hydrolase
MRVVAGLCLLLLAFFQADPALGAELTANVGLRSASASYQGEADQIKMLVWYPTKQNPEKTKLGFFELKVARDAQPTPGAHSLIVISHGTGGSHMGYWDIALHLASKGNFVVSLLHPRDNYADNSDARTRRNWLNRPRHIKTALDYILNSAEFEQYIDPGRIGIIGHSAGGYTALAAVGGIPDAAKIRAHCRVHGGDDPEFCGSSGIISTVLGIFSGQDSSPKDVIKNVRDPRIKAAVLMAPVGVLFHDPQALSRVEVPLLIYRAGKDEVLRYPYHAEAIHKNLAASHQYIVVNNAGHYSFLAVIPDNLKRRLGEIAKDPEGFNRAEFHEKLNQDIADFFAHSLQ